MKLRKKKTINGRFTRKLSRQGFFCNGGRGHHTHRSRTVTPKKCTRYGDALAIKLLFSLLKLLFFDLSVAVTAAYFPFVNGRSHF